MNTLGLAFIGLGIVTILLFALWKLLSAPLNAKKEFNGSEVKIYVTANRPIANLLLKAGELEFVRSNIKSKETISFHYESRIDSKVIITAEFDNQKYELEV